MPTDDPHCYDRKDSSRVHGLHDGELGAKVHCRCQGQLQGERGKERLYRVGSGKARMRGWGSLAQSDKSASGLMLVRGFHEGKALSELSQSTLVIIDRRA